MSTQLRAQERVPVSLEVVCESASGKRDARMSDINTSGCYIDSIAQVALGEIVTFKAHLPTGHWVQLRGEVVDREWHTGFDLRFTDLTEEEETLLAEVIRAKQGAPARRPVVRRDKDDVVPRREQDLGRVLVVEDDPVSMRLVTAIVEKEGYAAVPAWDGREA